MAGEDILNDLRRAIGVIEQRHGVKIVLNQVDVKVDLEAQVQRPRRANWCSATGLGDGWEWCSTHKTAYQHEVCPKANQEPAR